jgi:hypothetical protein
MTENVDRDPDWANRYLQGASEATERDPELETSAEVGLPPEAVAYMDDLTDADISSVHPDNRDDHLETALRALIRGMTAEGVTECTRHGRPAAAFHQNDRIVVTMPRLGEVIHVGQRTAALLAFAHECEPPAEY